MKKIAAILALSLTVLYAKDNTPRHTYNQNVDQVWKAVLRVASTDYNIATVDSADHILTYEQGRGMITGDVHGTVSVDTQDGKTVVRLKTKDFGTSGGSTMFGHMNVGKGGADKKFFKYLDAELAN